MQRAFSARMADTGDATYAAEKAGYAKPATAGGKLMAIADVAEDARRRARHTLVTKGAEVGVRVLIELAEDVKQKGSTRGAAAKSLVQLSGISNAAALSEEDLAELPADKIRALLAEAQRALAARMAAAKTIDHEPAESPQSAQAAPNLFD
jgi:hypothetical protein